MIIQVIENGVVVNVVEVDDDGVLASDGSKVTGGPHGDYPAPTGCTLMKVDGATFGWTVSGSTPVPPAEPTQN